MTKHTQILNTIGEIRRSHSEMTNIYLNGSCLNMFCILRSIYPQAKAWFNIDHVITEIDGRFYDITGQVQKTNHMPFTEIYNKRRTSRSFTHMYNSERDICAAVNVSKTIRDINVIAYGPGSSSERMEDIKKVLQNG